MLLYGEIFSHRAVTGLTPYRLCEILFTIFRISIIQTLLSHNTLYTSNIFISLRISFHIYYLALLKTSKIIMHWSFLYIKGIPRDYCPKQGPIDIQDCRPQQGRQTQQSTGVTLFVTEEMYWPMPTANGSVRCLLLVVVTTTD